LRQPSAVLPSNSNLKPACFSASVSLFSPDACAPAGSFAAAVRALPVLSSAARVFAVGIIRRPARAAAAASVVLRSIMGRLLRWRKG
jgi:hypothetical protein